MTITRRHRLLALTLATALAIPPNSALALHTLEPVESHVDDELAAGLEERNGGPRQWLADRWQQRRQRTTARQREMVAVLAEAQKLLSGGHKPLYELPTNIKELVRAQVEKRLKSPPRVFAEFLFHMANDNTRYEDTKLNGQLLAKEILDHWPHRTLEGADIASDELHRQVRILRLARLLDDGHNPSLLDRCAQALNGAAGLEERGAKRAWERAVDRVMVPTIFGAVAGASTDQTALGILAGLLFGIAGVGIGARRDRAQAVAEERRAEETARSERQQLIRRMHLAASHARWLTSSKYWRSAVPESTRRRVQGETARLLVVEGADPAALAKFLQGTLNELHEADTLDSFYDSTNLADLFQGADGILAQLVERLTPREPARASAPSTSAVGVSTMLRAGPGQLGGVERAGLEQTMTQPAIQMTLNSDDELWHWTQGDRALWEQALRQLIDESLQHIELKGVKINQNPIPVGIHFRESNEFKLQVTIDRTRTPSELAIAVYGQDDRGFPGFLTRAWNLRSDSAFLQWVDDAKKLSTLLREAGFLDTAHRWLIANTVATGLEEAAQIRQVSQVLTAYLQLDGLRNQLPQAGRLPWIIRQQELEGFWTPALLVAKTEFDRPIEFPLWARDAEMILIVSAPSPEQPSPITLVLDPVLRNSEVEQYLQQQIPELSGFPVRLKGFDDTPETPFRRLLVIRDPNTEIPGNWIGHPTIITTREELLRTSLATLVMAALSEPRYLDAFKEPASATTHVVHFRVGERDYLAFFL